MKTYSFGETLENFLITKDHINVIVKDINDKLYFFIGSRMFRLEDGGFREIL